MVTYPISSLMNKLDSDNRGLIWSRWIHRSRIFHISNALTSFKKSHFVKISRKLFCSATQSKMCHSRFGNVIANTNYLIPCFLICKLVKYVSYCENVCNDLFTMFVEYLTRLNWSMHQFINELITKLEAYLVTRFVSTLGTSRIGYFENRKH